MTDIWLPNDVRIAQAAPRLIDNTGRFSSPLTGAFRSVSRPGDRWGIRLDYSNLQGLDRARLESVIANQRGAANRLIYSPIEFGSARGSFPDDERFTNNNFANGTTGWGNEANFTISAVDRVIRSTRVKSDGTISGMVAPGQGATLTQFLPYIVRFFTRQGRGTDGQTLYNNAAADGGTADLSVTTVWGRSSYAVSGPTYGLLWGVRVPRVTGNYSFGTYTYTASGGFAGDYYDVLWSSLSQCFLVDNGTNQLLWSDDFTNAAWSKNGSTVSLSAVRAPDGTLTADSLVETATTGTHHVAQAFTCPSSACDICFTIAAIPSTRNWLAVEMIENTGGTGVVVYFNVSTGASGTSGTGANWGNTRVYASPLGNGWYQLTVISRKNNAATNVSAYALLASADNTQSYTGTAGVGMQIWRATVALSSVPVQLTQSTSVAVTSPPAQTGSAIDVKGLPVNTSGLLLPGDWIEINKELKRVTASLNSDGNGLGYLQFSPPLRASPADNDPVIVNTPCGRFVLSASENGWQTAPGYFATSSLDLVEAA